MLKLTIELLIEGGKNDAQTVVEEMLDQGVIQDWINDHELDAGELHVESAMLATVEDLSDDDDNSDGGDGDDDDDDDASAKWQALKDLP